MGAIAHARVKRLVFGAIDKKRGAVCSALSLANADFWRIQASSSAWLIPIQWLPGACQKYRK
jgi:tRNA(Arg) A34 adenosine deaminase TadA